MNEIPQTEQEASSAFARLYAIVRRLRAPGGCPWDREQTPASLRSTLIEEVFETADAIAESDSAHIAEELGDVLLNLLMIAHMYEQEGGVSVKELIDNESDKLIRRHPHVFSESAGQDFVSETADTAEKVLDQWDVIKQEAEGRQSESVLDSVPEGFPPLLKAYKMQKKASKKGFDWASADEVYPKVREEFAEVEEAALACKRSITHDISPLSQGAPDQARKAQLALEEETGDLLFAIVNWARHMGVDASVALSRANAKFNTRFRYIEKKMHENGLKMNQETLSAMDAFWDEAKRLKNTT